MNDDKVMLSSFRVPVLSDSDVTLIDEMITNERKPLPTTCEGCKTRNNCLQLDFNAIEDHLSLLEPTLTV